MWCVFRDVFFKVFVYIVCVIIILQHLSISSDVKKYGKVHYILAPMKAYTTETLGFRVLGFRV